MVVQSSFQQIINFLKKGVKHLSLKHTKQTEHVVEQPPPAYSVDEKNPLQQSSDQLTIQVLGNSARILLEESEKALLNAGDKKMKQSPPAYSVDEKNPLQQSSAQLTIKVLGNSARILLEGREAIARAVESEKALLNAGGEKIYSLDEKNPLQQSSAQLTIQVLGDSARILLEGREAIAHAAESEKALLNAGDEKIYSLDQKNPLQQSSAQLTIQVLGNSARILLEGREAIARAVESEKAILNAGGEKMI